VFSGGVNYSDSGVEDMLKVLGKEIKDGSTSF
jgi:hypothetical protein